MTREEILALPAGHELNQAVASAFTLEGVHVEAACFNINGLDTAVWRVGVPCEGYRQTFDPSADIEAAWLVRDAVAKEVFSVRYKFTHELQLVVSRRLGLHGPTLLHHSEIVLRVTPEDLCRAALLAMREVVR